MAWETGTATNYVDLVNKVRDFLTTNTTLVSTGEHWEQVAGNTGVIQSDDIVTLRGKGLADTDNIYCYLKPIGDVTNDKYAVEFQAHGAFIQTDPQDSQPLSSSAQYVLAWNDPIQYWIIANGRRWILITKVAGVFGSGYCGFFLPYSPPSEYPYPFYNAGSTSGEFLRYSTNDVKSHFFASPGYQSAQVFRPDNKWGYVSNFTENGSAGVVNEAWIYPTRFKSTQSTHDSRASYSGDDITNNTQPCFDNTYLMRQLQIHISDSFTGMLGVLDGVFAVTGRTNSSENIISKGGVDYLVVQNIFRTDFKDYMAVRLD